MNYLAHLFLAQPNPASRMGNLLGDFCKGVNPATYSRAVQAGLYNHRLVDRFTDNHALVKEAKRRFSDKRRRFAGIALDVLFDHFLLRQWQQFSHQPISDFLSHSYGHLQRGLPDMPQPMQRVIKGMIEQNWLLQYQSLEGVGYALDRISERIRFANDFDGSVEEIEVHYPAFEACFAQFFPELIEHVNLHGPEAVD
ncbi:ACP phosphodiesterase [Lacimicrobium sp. SS2-24]|uniref:acyl carrier protein phosphodiesterase n=1 Tax=Lacimicrobium sp. SS2-24 TaxID=2005569 RepID=UPI000B4B3B8D|nr:ACP phosphodiesterase [Lacimicrobium sp. SS2-24]